MVDEDFLSGLLFNDLKDQYIKERAESFKRVETDFKQVEEDLRRRIEQGIEDDRRHREALTLAVNLFSNKEFKPFGLGYRFIHGAPLHELGIKNCDFLLSNQDPENPIVIIGEAKGSITKPEKVVAETFSRVKIAEDHLDYIKHEYLKTEVNPRLESVLVFPAIESVGIFDAIAKVGGGLIPWMIDTGENRVSLKLPSSIQEPIRHSMLHSDNALNIALKQARSTDKGFDIFPQSHPVTKLRSIAIHALKSDRKYVVDENVLFTRIKRDLFYLPDTEIRKIVTEIIHMGLEIGVLELNNGDIVISMKWTSRTSIEREIQNAWINHRLSSELHERKQQAKENLRAKFLAEQEKRPSLEDFDIGLK